MQNHQFDLQTGDSLRLGDYNVTLLKIDGDAVVLEIEGPDGADSRVELVNAGSGASEDQLVLS